MRTETVEIYTFQELSEDAKEKARKWFKNGMHQDFHIKADMISESMVELAKERGFEFDGKRAVSWQLSYCQGDYVGLHDAELSKEKMHYIVAEQLNDDEKELFKFLTENRYVRIYGKTNHHHYYHQQFNVEVEAVDYPENELTEAIMDSFIDKLEEVAEKAFKGYVEDFCYELKRGGYEEMDYYDSDEYVDENIINNEYEFTKEGERW
jgi:hypothetical protein